MKTFIRYEDLPKDHLAYLGSENGDGSMSEELADAIDAAREPAQLIDEAGVHYFDLEGFGRA